jgi:membrane protease YdiL (CAAX protease family)
VEDPLRIPRSIYYLSAVVAQLVLTLLTAGVVWWEGMGLTELRLRPLAPLPYLLWSAGTTAVGLLTIWGSLLLQARCRGKEPALVGHLMPSSPAEVRFFLLLSMSAGLSEEFIFRGFALVVLERILGFPVLAVLIQAAAFGLVHAYQSRWGMLRAALLGVVLAVPAIFTGSIFASMTAHLLLDAAAGLWIWPRLGARLTDPAASPEET